MQHILARLLEEWRENLDNIYIATDKSTRMISGGIKWGHWPEMG